MRRELDPVVFGIRDSTEGRRRMTMEDYWADSYSEFYKDIRLLTQRLLM